MRVLTTSVTALRFLTFQSARGETADVLFAGVGNQVQIIKPGSEHPIATTLVFPNGETVHGFSDILNNRTLAYGGRYVAIIRLDVSEDFARGSVHVEVVKEFEDWVCSCAWIGQCEFAVVACGHSVSWICRGSDLHKEGCVQSTERELTWSTTLFQGPKDTDLFAVAGTSFGDVLVWRVLSNDLQANEHQFPKPRGGERGSFEVQRLRSVHRLKGHDGPIMKIKVSSNAQRMVSASVDRTVRIWETKQSRDCTACAYEGCFVPTIIHYGHLARVWDVAFIPSGPMDVVSVAEDRTCRVWSGRDASKELAIYYGHAGRNVWSLDVCLKDLNTAWIATGGEDGEVKIRSVPVSSSQLSLKNAGKTSVDTIASRECVSKTFQIPGNYPNPRKTGGAYNESGRTMIIPRKGTVVLSTDFGRIMTASFSSLDTSEVVNSFEASWTELYRDRKGIAFTPSSLSICRGLIFAGQTDGNVTILSVDGLLGVDAKARKVLDLDVFLEARTMVMGTFVAEDTENDECHLFAANSSGDLYHWQVSTGTDGLVLAKYRRTYRQRKPTKSALVTSVLYVPFLEAVIVGDRGGRVIVYWDDAEDLEHLQDVDVLTRVDSYPLSICRPHCDRVSSLERTGSIRSTLASDGNVLQTCSVMTAGFDGRMSRLCLSLKTQNADNFESKQLSLTVTSLEKTIERVDTIGKLMFPTVQRTGKTVRGTEEAIGRYAYDRHCVFGFRAADVIVWDVQQRNELFRKNCGNWRRAYAFHLDLRCSGQHSSSSRLIVEWMTFAFWRAGRLHIVQTKDLKEETVKMAKEITQESDSTFAYASDSKYVQSIGASFHGQRANAVEWICESSVFITASEDTTLRVIILSNGRWVTCQTLSRHISGVNDLTAMMVRSGLHVVFSAGGCDEIVVWVAQSPKGPWKDVCMLQVEKPVRKVIGNGDQQERQPLHRVLCVKGIAGKFCSCDKQCAMAAAGRSDGSIVLVRAFDNKSNGFRRAGHEWDSEVIWIQSDAHDGAVLCVDGEEGRILEKDLFIAATGDTRGTIVLWVADLDLACTERQLIPVARWNRGHDGGVNCISVRSDGDEILVVSGGDDERVHMHNCTLCVQEVSGVVSGVNEQVIWRSTLGMHTAAVTGICFVREGVSESGEHPFISVGADQRIELGVARCEGKDGAKNLWHVETNENGTNTRMNVSDVAAVCTSIMGDQRAVGAVVAGCGLEAVYPLWQQ